jgi:cytochrome oxidase Cu insertion factor (SCO1/SenC/PrrC family)
MSEPILDSTARSAPQIARTPRTGLVLGMAGLAILAVVLAFFMPVPGRFRPKPKFSENLNDLAPVANRLALPEFQLTERNGKAIGKKELEGKVWIAAFVFTRCTMGCPSVTGTMARLQAELQLAERDDLRLVSFTVDPERDQLEDLQKYAKLFRASETKWLFLTGTEEQVRPLLKEGFKITADRKKDGKPGDEYDHSTKLAVVDKQGRICGYFDGKQGDHDQDGSRLTGSLERLKSLVDQLVNE